MRTLIASGLIAIVGCQSIAPVTPSAVRSIAAAPETIDLAAALRMAGVDNPTIQLARERVVEAQADELAARSLLLPSVNVGANVYVHRGNLQSALGVVQEVDRQGAYIGAGARAAGASTVTIPGAWLFAHLGDAAFEPQATGQRVMSRGGDSQGVQLSVLRDVATLYLQLAGAEARLEVLRRGVTDLAEIARLTRVYADRGQGRRADADRATANVELMNRQVREAEEDVSVVSARLCRLLNVEPSSQLRTSGGNIAILRLISEESELEKLIADALRFRPELTARAADIQEAQIRVRQERLRPWLPILSVGYSGGAFGGGSDLSPSDFSTLDGRSNLDVAAVWNFSNLGVGNRARVRLANADVGQAIAAHEVMKNQIRREVAESLAEAKAAAQQVTIARAAIDTAEDGFRLESERIRQGQGRPIETIDSFRQLLDSRQELIRAMIAYDVAQFRLYAAVGSDPSSASIAVTGSTP